MVALRRGSLAHPLMIMHSANDSRISVGSYVLATFCRQRGYILFEQRTERVGRQIAYDRHAKSCSIAKAVFIDFIYTVIVHTLKILQFQWSRAQVVAIDSLCYGVVVAHVGRSLTVESILVITWLREIEPRELEQCACVLDGR